MSLLCRCWLEGDVLPLGMKKAIKIWMKMRLNPTAMGNHLLALKGEVVYSKQWRGECLWENREGRREWVNVVIESTQECQAGSPGLLWISEPAKMFLFFFFFFYFCLMPSFNPTALVIPLPSSFTRPVLSGPLPENCSRLSIQWLPCQVII